MKILAVVALAIACNTLAFAADKTAEPAKGEPPTVQPTKAFDPLRQLAGSWVGTSSEGGKETPATVDYAVTSGGSAVIEKLAAGTPHEMTSVYFGEGDKVAMTHYCMLGNHPKMTLKKSTPTQMFFEMQGTDGIQSAKEPHMHGLTITFKDPEHFTQEWSYFVDGKSAGVSTFHFTRKK